MTDELLILRAVVLVAVMFVLAGALVFFVDELTGKPYLAGVVIFAMGLICLIVEWIGGMNW